MLRRWLDTPILIWEYDDWCLGKVFLQVGWLALDNICFIFFLWREPVFNLNYPLVFQSLGRNWGRKKLPGANVLLFFVGEVPLWGKDRYPPKTNMTMENAPVESMYFLLKMVIFQCHVSFQGCKPKKTRKKNIQNSLRHLGLGHHLKKKQGPGWVGWNHVGGFVWCESKRDCLKSA